MIEEGKGKNMQVSEIKNAWKNGFLNEGFSTGSLYVKENKL